MNQITALFWDIGGVLLNNGWDHLSRHAASEKFGLDEKEFESRHDLIVADFETGRLTLDEYLDRTIFYKRVDFAREEFREFMFAQSQPISQSLELAKTISDSKQHLMCVLNNESAEINEYRIQKFGLKELFSIFVTSAYVDAKKPDAQIYQIALKLTQRAPAECLCIDDRPLNIECAARLGMQTILVTSPEQLRQDLVRLGIIQ